MRDRRYGELRRFTLDEPEYHEAIAALADGARADTRQPCVQRHTRHSLPTSPAHSCLLTGSCLWPFAVSYPTSSQRPSGRAVSSTAYWASRRS
ncbi:DUF5825 family protein [Streptomyces sp. M-16]|uniref:DUF5825 family protein n=1 Tax=Streptomyces sp. M-16 TaxID=3233040 RepID=UPI003F9E7DEC